MTMLIVVFLALFNGCCISFCRILNGRLGQDTSAFNASLWNHVVGFVFLSIIVYCTSSLPVNIVMKAPVTAWLGGVIGALFVALNSYVLSRVGATLTALLVIGGQLLTGVLWDAISHGAEFSQLAGVLCILAGVLLTKYNQGQQQKK
ncbi:MULTISPECIES: DMT family transporter [unclassified Shewanella]|uniref:DMT family transporter n=1 Tax=unclassified Shewanella TaxID=196818 RepID=UPI0018E318A7|nr:MULTISPECIES: DMT family transporter [unclassified Shewanella]